MSQLIVKYRETDRFMCDVIAELEEGDDPEGTAQDVAADHAANAYGWYVRGVSLGSQDGVLIARNEIGEFEIGRYDYTIR